MENLPVDNTPIDRDYTKEFETYRRYVGACLSAGNETKIDAFTEFTNPEIE